ncbi:MAG: N-acetylmuramoyl-L-alanine amidase [Elusimicrobiales bacterium]
MLKLLSGFLLLAALWAPVHARVDQVTYMKNGVYSGKIGTYALSGTPYLDAKQAAKLIGGKIYWYPVSGKLMLQIKGKTAVFFLKTDSVQLNGVNEQFPAPMIVRGGKAFLALDFFVSRLFSEAFGFSLQYNKATGVLDSQREVNITSMNFFTHPDKTRVVVYMEAPLEWQAVQKENNQYRLNIFNGVAAREEKLVIGDGVLRGVDLIQENKTARLVIAPDENFGKVEVFRLSDPDRLVIDVARENSPVAQSINGPAAEPQPAAAVPVIAPSEAPAAPSPAAVAPGLPDRTELGAGKKTVVIDAGHGGKDPGGKKLFGLKEKEINLAVAKELHELLKGEEIFDVVMTRSTDEFVPLADRSVIANNAKADIFISIHANAARNRSEKGFEIFFMSEKASDPWAAEVADFENSVISLEDGAGQQMDPAVMLLHSMARNEYLNEGSKLAGLVRGEMQKRTPFVDRGVKQAAFYVLRGTYAPGILVEIGFMTNASDQKHMNDKKTRAKVANAIYRGVMRFAEMKNWK